MMPSTMSAQRRMCKESLKPADTSRPSSDSSIRLASMTLRDKAVLERMED